MGKPAQAREQSTAEAHLAAIVAALPKGVSFLAWYENCDERDFVGPPAVKRAAVRSWDVLQGMGEILDLTVRELLEEGFDIDLGPDPRDEEG